MKINSLQRYRGYVVGMCWASFVDDNKLFGTTRFLAGENQVI